MSPSEHSSKTMAMVRSVSPTERKLAEKQQLLYTIRDLLGQDTVLRETLNEIQKSQNRKLERILSANTNSKNLPVDTDSQYETETPAVAESKSDLEKFLHNAKDERDTLSKLRSNMKLREELLQRVEKLTQPKKSLWSEITKRNSNEILKKKKKPSKGLSSIVQPGETDTPPLVAAEQRHSAPASSDTRNPVAHGTEADPAKDILARRTSTPLHQPAEDKKIVGKVQIIRDLIDQHVKNFCDIIVPGGLHFGFVAREPEDICGALSRHIGCKIFELTEHSTSKDDDKCIENARDTLVNDLDPYVGEGCKEDQRKHLILLIGRGLELAIMLSSQDQEWKFGSWEPTPLGDEKEGNQVVVVSPALIKGEHTVLEAKTIILRREGD